MWPWGHAAIGFLAFNLVTLTTRRRVTTVFESVVVLVATQVPDLIDKPLAWTYGVLPSGRSLGHSLLTATVLVVLVTIVARRYDQRTLSAAFFVGYLAGILMDIPSSVLSGDFSGATFLLWPLLPAPTYGTEQTFTAHLSSIDVTGLFLTQIGLTVFVFVLWVVIRDRHVTKKRRH